MGRRGDLDEQLVRAGDVRPLPLHLQERLQRALLGTALDGVRESRVVVSGTSALQGVPWGLLPDLALIRDIGTIQLMLMPYQRARTFPGEEGYPRLPLPVHAGELQHRRVPMQLRALTRVGIAVDELPDPGPMTYATGPESAGTEDAFYLLRGKDGVTARTVLPLDRFAEGLDLFEIMRRRLTITGSTMRPRI